MRPSAHPEDDEAPRRRRPRWAAIFAATALEGPPGLLVLLPGDATCIVSSADSNCVVFPCQ
jgi:hypothetical protein